jgi:hypothetical protein
MFIYVIKNSATGKIYIGQHKGNNLKKYLQMKLSQAVYELKRKGKGGGSHLFASMRKHPKDVWSIEPLFEGIETKAELDRLERLAIALYDTRNPDVGYNICKGGEGFTGKHSPEAKTKMSIQAKKAWANDPQRKLNQSLLRTGVPRPLEVRAKISKSNMGKVATQETKEKIRANRLLQADPRLGTTHSEDSKRKMSEANRGKPSHMRGKQHTEESNKKNRQAHIKALDGCQFGNMLVLSLAGTVATHAYWSVRCTVCNEEGVVTRTSRVLSSQSRFARKHRHINFQLLQTK